MSLMDGRLENITDLQRANYSHVRTWGVLHTDTGLAELRSTCRRCGKKAYGQDREAADAFRTDHRGANGLCPYESEVIY